MSKASDTTNTNTNNNSDTNSKKEKIVITSERSKKAKEIIAKKEQRKNDKLKSELDAKEKEEKRIADEKYKAMLAAESHEQKLARKKAHQEKLEREQKEREEEFERKRLAHVNEGLAIAFQKRREGAKMTHSFNNSNNIIIDELPGNSGALSLFDIDHDENLRNIVDKRLEKRFLNKSEYIANGGIDVVLENSGPPITILPKGYVVDPLMPLPPIELEDIYHRRCMVVFNEPKATGWFPGLVNGVSKRSGYNFTVKFDRMETHSIDIDGIKSCALDVEGPLAYNKGWCLLMPDPDYIPSGLTRPNTRATIGTTSLSRPGTTDTNAGK